MPLNGADLDLAQLDGPATGQLKASAAGYQGIAEDLSRVLQRTAAIASGKTVEKGLAAGADLSAALHRHANAAAALPPSRSRGVAAFNTFRGTAPSISQLHQAQQRVSRAKQRVTDSLYSKPTDIQAAQQELTAAQGDQVALEAQRKAALAKLAAAEAAEAGKLHGQVPSGAGGGGKEGQSNPRDIPSHPAPGPVPRATTPGGHAPGPSPATHPSAAAAGTAAGTTPTRDQAANLANLLAGQQQPKGQPVQLPQQQQPALTPPPAPAMGGAAKNDRKAPFTVDDLNKPAGTPVPVALMTAHSPAAAAPAAAPAPATSGTSETDLHTDTNTSGRSDPPRTALSAAGVQNAVGAGGAGATGTAQGQPMGQGGMPMMPPIGSGGTGGGGATGKILKYQSPDQAELNGHTTKHIEVVRGGTIAQRRDGAT